MRVGLTFFLWTVFFSTYAQHHNEVELYLKLEDKTIEEGNTNEGQIIIQNNTDSSVTFYENWNSFGFYNFHFEILVGDSIFKVKRPHRLWWRNYPSTFTIEPDSSFSISINLIDTSMVNDAKSMGIHTHGWIGVNKIKSKAKIRVVYDLQKQDSSLRVRDFKIDEVKGIYPASNKNMKSSNYQDTLNSHHPEYPGQTIAKTNSEFAERSNYNIINIFNTKLKSDWVKVKFK